MAQISHKQNLAATGDEDGGDVWTSGWTQIGTTDRIIAVVFADQVCDVSIQQSGDGENVDFETKDTGTANKGIAVREEALLPYYRIVVTNTAGSATTEFRAYLRTTSAGPR